MLRSDAVCSTCCVIAGVCTDTLALLECNSARNQGTHRWGAYHWYHKLLYVWWCDFVISSVQNVLLTNGSVGLEQFISSKAPLYSEYRLFTVLNAEDVTNKAAKPQLKEIGPFVYRCVRVCGWDCMPWCHTFWCRENRTKIDLVWEDEGNVLKFSQLINYTYNEVLSYGLDPHTTKVTTVNLPLMVSHTLLSDCLYQQYALLLGSIAKNWGLSRGK